MCGIVGYVGNKQAVSILVDGLKSLEYRGYDSAGIAIASSDHKFQIIRASGKIVNLESRVNLNDLATVGIGHTRWATHGRPTEGNAHPHCDSNCQVVAVHNGIFENFLELRSELKAAGQTFSTDTDTECFPVMVANIMRETLDFRTAFIEAVGRMRGIYAIACLSALDFGRILVARSGPPLVIGLGDGENFVASDIVPLLCHTRRVIYLDDGDLAEVTADNVTIFRLDGEIVKRPVTTIPYGPAASEKGNFKHFMQKEIFEQSTAVSNTLIDRLSINGGPVASDLPFTDEELRSFEQIVLIACGTSFNAGLVGKFYFEQLAKISVEVDYASEYRYRKPIVRRNTLAIGITQSGETADTLAALKEASACGARTLVICNVRNSTATRQTDGCFLTQAGPEIGVASTKVFTTQLVALLLIAMRLGELRGTLDITQRNSLVQALLELPATLDRVMGMENKIYKWAKKCREASDCIYLGRGLLYPIALEGALKLKEISYIHAEGFPAGEMKHGPIALVDQHLPIIALMPGDAHRDKTLSNLQEVAARDGRILALVTEGDNGLVDIADDVLYMPASNSWLAPILYVIPLQLLAYHISVLRGCDVDQPRNLAKSVTVE